MFDSRKLFCVLMSECVGAGGGAGGGVGARIFFGSGHLFKRLFDMPISQERYVSVKPSNKNVTDTK
jgi:hypothetical protein